VSALIHKAEAKGELHGNKICRNAPIVSHSIYEVASGQAINLHKSEFFCGRNVLPAVRESTAKVTLVLGTGKYLGLPSMIGRSKKSTFKFIKVRIWRKINSWSSRHLSQASREVMIKPILQAISAYMMSIFLLPCTLIDEIEKMLNSFWWGHRSNNDRDLHWISWERLSVSKDHGGMSLKNIQSFNLAMLENKLGI
jgi:hypothetical protein